MDEDICYGEDAYYFSYPRRGVAVIIINDIDHIGNYRKASEIDLKYYKDIFVYFGFDICILHNNTHAELLENLQRIAKEDHSECDCFALAVSSHGDRYQFNGVQEDVIITIDYPIKTRDIMAMFTDKACPSLAGKPKLFFIQACRGQEADGGIDVLSVKVPENDQPKYYHVKNDEIDAIRVNFLNEYTSQYMSILNLQKFASNNAISVNSAHSSLIYKTTCGRQIIQEQGGFEEPVLLPTPCYKDFLVMCATPSGYYSFRRVDTGSWFVKCLAEVLLKSDGSRSLVRELTRVTGLVAHCYMSSCSDPHLNNKKQTPVIYSMLSKDIYLTPKKNVNN